MNMGTVITILEFVLLFGLLIFLHELGHFIVARLSKIEVEEFGFGFPPRLLTLGKIGGTLITLNWIPFGGFVRPKGENDAGAEGGLAAAGPWKRLSVALGGPVMNLVAGVILFSLVFVRIGAPNEKKVEVYSVNPGSPAAQSGLMSGDLIVAMNGEPITSADELAGIVKANLGRSITIVYQRDGQQVETRAVPREKPPEGQGELGITMTNPMEPISWPEAMPYAVKITYLQARQLVLLPGQLIRGTVNSDEVRLSGPVGIYDMYAQARERDQDAAGVPPSPQSLPPVNSLFLMASISVALGLTNLLPLPALDGGRILFTLPEILTGKRVPQQYENLVHLIGFATLLLLMIYITAQDIIHPAVLP